MKYLILLLILALHPPSFAQFNFYHGMLFPKAKPKLTLSCTNSSGFTEVLNTELPVNIEDSSICQAGTTISSRTISTFTISGINWSDTTTGNAMFSPGTLTNNLLPINVGVCGYNTGTYNGTISWTDSSGGSGSTPLILKCPKNIWGSGSDGDQTLTLATTNLCTEDTSNATCIKQYTNLTINSGVTVSTGIPKKGLIIYVNGNLTLNGTISMTKRGASGDVGGALTIHRIKTSGAVSSGSGSTSVASSTLWSSIESKQPSISATNVGVLFTFPRQGAAGTQTPYDQQGYSGSSGNANNSYTLITGGGGSGGSLGVAAGASSHGSPFTGGSGSAGSRYQGTNGAATAYGGAAGAASGGSQASGGGSGNPGSAGVGASSVAGEDGTGGLIILFVKGSITGSGSVVSRGGNGGKAGALTFSSGGGGSGGGNILIIHAGTSNRTSANVIVSGGTGGPPSPASYERNGGAGGAGSWKVEQVDR